jgi:hypothetical protein
MWRPGLEVVGTIVLLELLARGGVQGGQNQGKVGDLTATGVIGGPGLELHSANPRHLGTLPYSHLSSGVGGKPGWLLGSEISHLS